MIMKVIYPKQSTRLESFSSTFLTLLEIISLQKTARISDKNAMQNALK